MYLALSFWFQGANALGVEKWAPFLGREHRKHDNPCQTITAGLELDEAWRFNLFKVDHVVMTPSRGRSRARKPGLNDCNPLEIAVGPD